MARRQLTLLSDLPDQRVRHPVDLVEAKLQWSGERLDRFGAASALGQRHQPALIDSIVPPRRIEPCNRRALRAMQPEPFERVELPVQLAVALGEQRSALGCRPENHIGLGDPVLRKQIGNLLDRGDPVQLEAVRGEGQARRLRGADPDSRYDQKEGCGQPLDESKFPADTCHNWIRPRSRSGIYPSAICHRVN